MCPDLSYSCCYSLNNHWKCFSKHGGQYATIKCPKTTESFPNCILESSQSHKVVLRAHTSTYSRLLLTGTLDRHISTLTPPRVYFIINNPTWVLSMTEITTPTHSSDIISSHIFFLLFFSAVRRFFFFFFCAGFFSCSLIRRCRCSWGAVTVQSPTGLVAT